MRSVRLRTGVRVGFTLDGSGPELPVVLLHAWGESLGCFDLLRPLLPGWMRVAALDQRGHGRSDKPAHGYALRDSAADVVAFLDALDLPAGVLLGSSSGGYVAQQVAVDAPGRVAGLVLVGAPRSLRGRAPFADEVERLTDPVSREWVQESLRWFPLLHPVPAGYVADRVEDGVRVPAHVWRAALHGLGAAVPPTEAATITAPTLIIRGGRDELLSREDQEGLQAAIPGSRLVAYEDTGHLVLWEQPQRVARDVADFVATLNP